MLIIIDVYVCEVLDFCGNLIVEVEVLIESGVFGCVLVLLGVLIGEYEVVELCDGDKLCYLGKGVIKVVENVNEIIVLEIIEGEFLVLD